MNTGLQDPILCRLLATSTLGTTLASPVLTQRLVMFITKWFSEFHVIYCQKLSVVK